MGDLLPGIVPGSPFSFGSSTDVPDGEYTIEVPRMPADWLKAAELPPEERKPLHRETVKVENGKDLEWDIRIGSSGAGPAGARGE